MNTNQQQGFKPLIIKYIAVIVSVLYVLSPLNKELSGVMYQLVHIFEAPQIIIFHHKELNNKNGVDLSNVEFDDIHSHQLVDFVSSLFENSDESDKSPIVKTLKIDKHLTYVSYELINFNFKETKKNVFFFKGSRLLKGFQKKIKAPPQIIFS